MAHAHRCAEHRHLLFFFSSRRRHTRCSRDWSSDVCSSDLYQSIARGDRPQVVDLLILETPICTIPDYKDSPNTDAFQGQDTIQVRRAESTWRDVGRLTGRRVVVTGTLSEWALGPDRTPVVIDPTEVRPALP